MRPGSVLSLIFLVIVTNAFLFCLKSSGNSNEITTRETNQAVSDPGRISSVNTENNDEYHIDNLFISSEIAVNWQFCVENRAFDTYMRVIIGVYISEEKVFHSYCSLFPFNKSINLYEKLSDFDFCNRLSSSCGSRYKNFSPKDDLNKIKKISQVLFPNSKGEPNINELELELRLNSGQKWFVIKSNKILLHKNPDATLSIEYEDNNRVDGVVSVSTFLYEHTFSELSNKMILRKI